MKCRQLSGNLHKTAFSYVQVISKQDILDFIDTVTGEKSKNNLSVEREKRTELSMDDRDCPVV